MQLPKPLLRLLAVAALAAVTAAATTGCRRQAPVADTPAAPTPAHMQAVLDAAQAAREALIAGQTRAARSRLGWLAEQAISEAPPPEAWAGYATRVREEAAKGANGETLVEVSAGLAQMGAACGECHAAADVAPAFASENLPAGSEVSEHMARHRWALDSMWEGLVTPDAHRWRSGAYAFLEEPLEGAEGESLPEGAASWSKRVHDLGEAGLKTISAADRAELYGELLATCALCHQAAGEGPLAPR